jgi:diguanylate cyclase (GGDEF)-like protein
MPYQKLRWGLILFLCAPIMVGGMVFLSLYCPFKSHLRLYTGALPIIGLACSLASFFIGHFSYPRVLNLKVYLVGYVTGIFGLGYFLLYRFPAHLPLPSAPEGFVLSLFLLVFLNILAIEFVPSFVKFRTAKHTVLSMLPVQCVILLICRFSPNAVKWAMVFSFDGILSPGVLSGILFMLLALLFSVWRIQDEFYLGGILAGCAFIYSIPWIARAFFPQPCALEILSFAFAPVFLEAGILVHWFARMEHRIAYDPLLHIYNRDYCSKIISEQSNLNLLPPLSIAMIDIDHFKNVNDTHGHQAGDQVLYTVAQTICREVVPDGVVCRYGGEELIIFFPHKSLSQTVPLVEKLRVVLEKTKTKTGKKTLSVTVSSGVSCREDPGQSIMDVIKAADKALYKAKEGGRNQVKSGRTTMVSMKKKKSAED